MEEESVEGKGKKDNNLVGEEKVVLIVVEVLVVVGVLVRIKEVCDIGTARTGRRVIWRARWLGALQDGGNGVSVGTTRINSRLHSLSRYRHFSWIQHSWNSHQL